MTESFKTFTIPSSRIRSWFLMCKIVFGVCLVFFIILLRKIEIQVDQSLKDLDAIVIQDQRKITRT